MRKVVGAVEKQVASLSQAGCMSACLLRVGSSCSPTPGYNDVIWKQSLRKESGFRVALLERAMN
jgi:hypothetical protein